MSYLNVSAVNGAPKHLEFVSLVACQPGWLAVIADSNFNGHHRYNVAMWAAFKDKETGQIHVLSVIGDDDIGGSWLAAGCPEDQYFMGYIGPGDSGPDNKELETRLMVLKEMFDERQTETP